MGQPYVGEIRQFAGNFAPQGWMFCDGSTLSIAQNDVLFELIGTTYGGDGQTTFNIPDLRGRFPIHLGTNTGTTYVIGQLSGTETVTLTTPQIPAHTHAPLISPANGGSDAPTSNYWGSAGSGKPYALSSASPTLNFNAATIQATGGNQPHDNMSPYLALSYIISLFGIFPSQ